ncbi:hypothetical protein OAE79_01550 [Rhodopirellula sp.]|nr:hypothetical protein [Rhodopirellula sp.]
MLFEKKWKASQHFLGRLILDAQWVTVVSRMAETQCHVSESVYRTKSHELLLRPDDFQRTHQKH